MRFAVGTAKDHIAPWRSVYKLHLFTDADLTFVLASGGHNVGIVSPVNGFADAGYHLAQRLAGAREERGSWWPCWHEWLAAHSGERVAPPAMGAPVLGPAPGGYVLQR